MATELPNARLSRQGNLIIITTRTVSFSLLCADPAAARTLVAEIQGAVAAVSAMGEPLQVLKVE